MDGTLNILLRCPEKSWKTYTIHCALTGDGAREFAEKYGFDVFPPEDLSTNKTKFTYEGYVSTIEKCFGPGSIPKQETQCYGDTVTAVAMDANGHFA